MKVDIDPSKLIGTNLKCEGSYAKDFNEDWVGCEHPERNPIDDDHFILRAHECSRCRMVLAALANADPDGPLAVGRDMRREYPALPTILSCKELLFFMMDKIDPMSPDYVFMKRVLSKE